MSPTDLGQKHECEECGAKYYDFGKTDVPCPACGHIQGAESSDEDSPKPAKKKKKAKKK